MTRGGDVDGETTGPERHTTRIVVAVVLVVVVAAIAIDNRQEAKVGFLFGDVRAPLIVVVIGATLVGIAIGWLLSHRSRRG